MIKLSTSLFFTTTHKYFSLLNERCQKLKVDPKIADRKLFFWIPACAGMTIKEFNFSPNRCHSCVSRNPEFIIYRNSFKYFYRQFWVIKNNCIHFYIFPNSICLSIQGITSSSISSKVVVASKPSTFLALDTSGTLFCTSYG